ncbi:MAG TPA: hypothetical protein DCQ58_05340, partial [Saprospirales bacterium]|nr:hypothetical protein [Saprospirales bacterium]
DVIILHYFTFKSYSMKKMLIGALVGGLLLFIWQFLSWSLLNVHGSQQQYTASQDTILEMLSNNLEEGTYFLPTVPEGTSQEEAQKFMEEQTGKPWAVVSYHGSMADSMPMNMLRGFAVDFLAALFLCWILMKFSNLTFTNALLSSLAVGFIGYFTVTYLNSIWFEGNTIPELIDVVVSWGLVGVWLGWWLKKR